VVRNRRLGGDYCVLELESDAPNSVGTARPGQFVMLRGTWGRDLLSPRAFSVLHAADDRRFSVLLRIVGRGTGRLAATRLDDLVTVTGPLGTPFPPPSPEAGVQLLVAGGVGLPPLHMQARVAAATVGAPAVELMYGARTSDDLVLLDDFETWGVSVELTTEDGSRGTTGLVTEVLQRRVARAQETGECVSILACGPEPMLRAVRRIGLAADLSTHLSLEAAMACGFGVCLGCAVPVYGDKPYRYCCTDGPVFDAREVRWS
jgi:dihydroorotate dehydrogenase electron transfer subunit